MSATARPELAGRREVPVGCRDQRGRVQVDDGGIPVTFSWVCRNRQCCPRRDGFVAVHTMTLHGVQNGRGVGEYVTEYVPTRSMTELVDALPPERVGRNGRASFPPEV